ncbi:glycosyltransferase family 4 protein [Synechococcus sp. GEYO]|uniref:glycosyltransferase family 4 protein n=1 Tax=Synechococcus sp. GEYO TaxID=2575511 RepID=UPI000E0E1C03|nr:glycosyltransferase family 4 protein [Synechococcus sp. GEYO]
MTLNHLGLLYASDAYASSSRKMGRQQSGVGLLSAMLRFCPCDRLPVVAPRDHDLSGLQQAHALHRPTLKLNVWPLDKLDRIQGLDSLLVSDPVLSRWADYRRWHSMGAKAFSLIGITHTLSTLGVLKGLLNFPSSDLYPWDGLICTSRCAREAVDHVFEFEGMRLAQRFGGSFHNWKLPQRPVIPLGCDLDRFKALSKLSAFHDSRKFLGLCKDRFVVLCVGRLEIHSKSHPGVLLQALARVVQQQRNSSDPSFLPCLLVLGTAQSSETMLLWKQVKDYFSSFFELRLLDGNDENLTDYAWSSADIFVTLADSLQETLGLTPIEAMARALPVIASDWNGYRDSVVHMVTGFLIPTSQPGHNAPQRLAELAMGRLNHNSFMADLMQQVVVEEDALVFALQQLVANSSLRKRMGEAGRQRAEEFYDWSTIINQFFDFSKVLTNSRLHYDSSMIFDMSILSPWRQFKNWASSTHSSTNIISWNQSRLSQRLTDQQNLDIYSLYSIRAESDLKMTALEPLILYLQKVSLDNQQVFSIKKSELYEEMPHIHQSDIDHALSWLSKLGAVELLP